jgi:hypothetical protein
MSKFSDSVVRNYFTQVAEIVRMGPIWVWAVGLFVLVSILQPVQVGILFWGLLKIMTGALSGFIVYRVVQKYAKPGTDPTAMHEIHWMYVRAIMIGAGMLAMGANL